jgi:hypothetical protein
LCQFPIPWQEQSFPHEKGSREVQVAPSRGFNGGAERFRMGQKVGSKLGPDSPEYPATPYKKTQNRAKRCDKIDNQNWFGTRGSEVQNPLSPTIHSRSGPPHIGNGAFRRHSLHFRPEGVLQGLKGFFLQVTVAETVMQDSVVTPGCSGWPDRIRSMEIPNCSRVVVSPTRLRHRELGSSSTAYTPRNHALFPTSVLRK